MMKELQNLKEILKAKLKKIFIIIVKQLIMNTNMSYLYINLFMLDYFNIIALRSGQWKMDTFN